MNRKPYREILDSAAADSLSRNVDLWPMISAQLERKSLMMTLRTRPIMAMLIALVVLLALSGAAYALGKAFGYIPGLGIVDQSAPLRVLAEPVSQTRDGITITIKEAVISSDKTIITLTMENIPFDKLSPLTDATCPQWPELRLSDRTPLKLDGGDSNVLAPNYEMRLIYPPMPADVHDAMILIPCIQRAAPGVLPENWELPLRFIPAPPDMTVLPVLEVATASEAGTTTNEPLTITKVIDTGDSYILTGEFQPLPASSQEIDSGTIGLKITDDSGRDVRFEGFPQDISLPTPTSPTAEVWSVKFNKKGFVPPLHITYTKEYIIADPSHKVVEFEFDAGENPQEGQTWQLNKEFLLAGRTFTLVSISTLPYSYEFNFVSSDNSIHGVGVDIDGFPPDRNGGGMDASAVGHTGSWSVSVGPYTELPRGKLKVIISRLWFIGEIKDWTIDWQP